MDSIILIIPAQLLFMGVRLTFRRKVNKTLRVKETRVPFFT